MECREVGSVQLEWNFAEKPGRWTVISRWSLTYMLAGFLITCVTGWRTTWGFLKGKPSVTGTNVSLLEIESLKTLLGSFSYRVQAKACKNGVLCHWDSLSLLLWLCSVMFDSAIPWTVAHQVPLSVEFSRQENWSGFLFPTPVHLPNSGIKPGSLVSPGLAGGFLTTAPPGKPKLSL